MWELFGAKVRMASGGENSQPGDTKEMETFIYAEFCSVQSHFSRGDQQCLCLFIYNCIMMQQLC